MITKYDVQLLGQHNNFNAAFLDLKRSGYLILNNIFHQEEISRIQNDCNSLLSKIYGDKDFNCPLISQTYESTSYEDLAKSPVAIALHRGLGLDGSTIDKGLLDIFNPHKYFEVHSKDTFELLKRVISYSNQFIIKINKKCKPKNSNLYNHINVKNPRIKHIDSIRNYFKVFLALSDQDHLECGPFGLIPRSNNKKLINYLMCVYNKKFLGKTGGEVTDGTFYADKELTPIFLSAGEIVITNVSAVHGAFPTDKGGRLTYVQTFDSK